MDRRTVRIIVQTEKGPIEATVSFDLSLSEKEYQLAIDDITDSVAGVLRCVPFCENVPLRNVNILTK